MKNFLEERTGNSLQLIIIEKYILYLCLLSRNADTVWLPVVGGGNMFWIALLGQAQWQLSHYQQNMARTPPSSIQASSLLEAQEHAVVGMALN